MYLLIYPLHKINEHVLLTLNIKHLYLCRWTGLGKNKAHENVTYYAWKMSRIANQERNTNKNRNEASLHSAYNDFQLKISKQ